jgi:hypothetical protein
MAKDADNIIAQLRESSAQIIRDAPLHCIWIDKIKYLPVDIDTTVMDNSKSKKEGVSRTYQGYDGYHPIMAYVGKVGLKSADIYWIASFVLVASTVRKRLLSLLEK